MRAVFVTILRMIILAVSFVGLCAVAGRLASPAELAARMTPEKQSPAALILPFASLMMAAFLVFFSLRTSWQGWKLAGVLAMVLYGPYIFLSHIETAVFPAINDQLPLPTRRAHSIEPFASSHLCGILLKPLMRWNPIHSKLLIKEALYAH